jgi:hypothetical protein
MKVLFQTAKNISSPLSAILLLMLGNGFFLTFTSLRLNSLGFDEWVVGVVHSAYYLGMLIGAARAENVINRIAHIRPYAAYAQGFWVYLFLFILGGLVFTLYPLAITEVCDRLQPEDITKATSMLLLTYGIGGVIGPLVAPIWINLHPTYGLFIFILTNATILIIMGLRSFIHSSAVPEEMQTEFLSLPRVSPVAYELDPRIDKNLKTEDSDD